MKKFSKRTLIITICALFIIISVAGVWAMAGNNISEEISKWRQQKSWQNKGTLENLIQENNMLSLSELSPYNYYEFLNFTGILGFVNLYLGRYKPYGLREFNDKYPIEYIKSIDSDHIYVVYKLYKEENETIYVYLVFNNCIGEYDKSSNDEFEYWSYRGEFYFISEELKFSDYSSIKAGDGIDNIASIDPTVYSYLYNIMAPRLGMEGTVKQFCTLHLLEDGYLVINYISDTYCINIEEATAHLKVSSITFYKNYENIKEAKPNSYLFKNGKVELPS